MRLLLDFGGVVIKTPFELLHRIGSPRWHGPFRPGEDARWQAMQAGEITEREYWAGRAEETYPGSEDPVRSLMERLFAPPPDDVVRVETMDLVRSVDRPAVLTNDLGRFHGPDWLESMGLTGVFDPLVDLSFVGFLKPSPEAYAHAVAALGTPPDQIVFVDDQPANVEGATAAGLRAMWFDVTDPAGSVRRVKEAMS